MRPAPRPARGGKTPLRGLFFGHGFNIRFGYITRAGVDVAMVAPKGPGHLVRRQFVEGGGVPCLIAVEQDASGKARDLALSYAKGIGGTRAGVHRDDVHRGDRDRPVRRAGRALRRRDRAGAGRLRDAGRGRLPAGVAYFECLHELKLIVDLMYEGGIAGMRYSISDTAEYGDYTRGPRMITAETKAEMKKILDEIQDGRSPRRG
jgi:ketol-acid reductoisomerase